MALKDKKYITLSDISDLMSDIQNGKEKLESILEYFNIPKTDGLEYQLLSINPEKLSIELFDEQNNVTYFAEICLGKGAMRGYSTTYITHVQTRYSELQAKDSYYFLGRRDPVIEEFSMESKKYCKKTVISLEERPNVQLGTERIAKIRLLNAKTNKILFEQTYMINARGEQKQYSFTDGRSMNYRDTGWEQANNSQVTLNSQFANIPNTTIMSLSGDRFTMVDNIYSAIKGYSEISREELSNLLSESAIKAILIKVRDSDGVFRIALISINNSYQGCTQFDYVDLMDQAKKTHNVIIPNFKNNSLAAAIKELSFRIEEDLSSPTNFLINDRLGRLVKILEDTNTTNELSPELIAAIPFDDSVYLASYYQNDIFKALLATYRHHFDGDIIEADKLLKRQLLVV